MNPTPKDNKSVENNMVYDVIIAGAGPVGLFLACELALEKCSVLILEKTAHPHSPLKQLPFGLRGLNAPTVEALYRRGLLEGLEAHKSLKNPHSNPKKGGQGPGGHFAGIVFQNENIDASKWQYRLDGATQTSLISEMEELETVLAHRAESLGVKIRRGMAIADFHQSGEGVTVQSDNYSFNAKWLVGCDGSRSVVRKKGGFEFAGTEPEFTGYSTLIDLADPEKLSPGRNVTERGMYVQSQPGYVVIQDFDGGAFHHSKKPVTLAHLQEMLRRISDTDVTINALHTATTWTDRARQATSYRNGRIFLAGDAAHIHAPLGGQGLNLGLGDAMNLGWKLAATIGGNAPEDLLDSYYTERYPIGAQVLDWSRAQVAIMKPDPGSRALNAIVRDLMNTRDGATYFAGRIWGVLTHYALDGSHPLTGYSVPNFEFEDGTKMGELMRSGKGILLDFAAETSLKTLAGEYTGQIVYLHRPAKEQLGLKALLIRPDGYVAWAADKDSDDVEARKSASHWFVPDADLKS
eukprot:gene11720-13680_t